MATTSIVSRADDEPTDEASRVSRGLLVYLAVFVVGIAAVSAFSIVVITRTVTLAKQTVEQVKVNGPIYQGIIRSQNLLNDVMPPPAFVLESYLVATRLTDATTPDEVTSLVQQFRHLHAEYESRLDYWQRELHEGPLKTQLIHESRPPAERFYRLVEEQFIPAIKAGDHEKADRLLNGPISAEYRLHRKWIDSVVALAKQRCAEDERVAQDVLTQSNAEVSSLATSGITTIILGTLGCAVVALIAGILTWQVLRRYVSGLAHANARLCREISQRIRTERILKANEVKYKTLYESSSDAIMLVTPGKGFTAGNPAALRLFGCRDEAEFISKNPSELSPLRQPDGSLSTEKEQRVIAAALRNGSYFFEWLHQRLNGTEFYASVLLTRMEIDGKSILQATVRDITSIKKSEDRLRQSEERYRLFAENVTDVIWTMDLAGHYTYVSPSIRNLLGYSAEEGVHLTIEEKLTPASQNIIHAKLHEVTEAARDGKRIDGDVVDVEQRRKNGTTVWTEVSFSGMYAETGELIGLQGVTRDISVRRMLDLQLATRESRLRSMVDNAFEFMGLMTPDGILLEANRTALLLIGADASAVLNKPFWDTPWWAHSSEVQQTLRDATRRAAHGEMVRLKITCCAQDGSVHWLDFLLKPLMDEYNHVQYLIPEGRDITELKQAFSSSTSASSQI